MDARIHLEAALGFDIGEAHMIRNAGGRAAESLRSLAISQQFLGTEEVLIIHHTGCGMATFKNPDIHGLIEERLEYDASHIDFLPFEDWKSSVLEDVELLKNSRLIKPGTPITGMLYDVKTGKVEVIAKAVSGQEA